MIPSPAHLFIFRASLPTYPTCLVVAFALAVVWWYRPRRLADEVSPRRKRKQLLATARANHFIDAPRYRTLPIALQDHKRWVTPPLTAQDAAVLRVRAAGRGMGRDR